MKLRKYHLGDLDDCVEMYLDFVNTLEHGDDDAWTENAVAERLRGILESPDVEVYVLREGRRDIGLLELDFRTPGDCELAFFGLVPEAIGSGRGRHLMDQALARAWARPIRRLWVHTCTFDHPSAVAFYTRSGFRVYALEVEIADDPRLTGHLPREAAPHIPVVE